MITVLIASSFSGSSVGPTPGSKQFLTPDQTERPKLRQLFARVPMSFEENRGQADSGAKFIARGGRFGLFLSATESVLAVTGFERKIGKRVDSDLRRRSTGLKFKFVGADPAAHVTGSEELPGKTNYLIGDDSTMWRTQIPTYLRVTCKQIYKGIDVVYYGNQGQLEYDLTLAPGADLAAIRIAFEGADSIRLKDGDLILETAVGEIRQAAPVAYQETFEGRTPVEARYLITSGHEVGFDLGEYDARLPVTIDPVLSYSSFLGGDGFDVGSDIAVDSSGFIYIVGATSSHNFPVAQGALQTALNGFNTDAFVTKLNPSGTEVIYSTFLGGSSQDGGFGGEDGFNQRQGAVSLALDTAGSVFLSGSTYSKDFPVTSGAFQLDHANDSQSDTFITKLSPAGDKLLYSTYLGGGQPDSPSDIAVDKSGCAYVTGNTYSINFPTASALQTAHSSDVCSGGDSLYLCSDAFVTKLDASGSALVYSTYLGGNKYDGGTGIAVDVEGSAYIAGITGSSNFPTTAGAFQTRFNGGSFIYAVQSPNAGDGFVSRLSPSGSELVYSTYLGGKGDDTALGIAIDAQSNAYVTGRTDSIDFPVTADSFQSANGGSAAYKSANSAGSWTPTVNGLAAEISAIAIDPRTPSNIYAGSIGTSFSDDRGGKIFKSSDSGATWKRVFTETVSSNGASMINALAVDPRNSNIVYAGALTRVYKSTDGGAQWAAAGAILPFPFVSINTIVIDPKNTDRVYFGTGLDSFSILTGGIFTSTNGGDSWEPASFNELFPTAGIVFSLAIDPKKPKSLYAGTARGIFRGLNRGKKWKESDLSDPNLSARAVAIDPLDRSRIYAGVADRSIGFNNPDEGGIYISTNSGKEWERVDAGLGGLSIASVAVDPRNPTTIYAGLQKSSATMFTAGRHFESFQGGVLKSTDRGQHWTVVGLNDVSVNVLAVDPQTPSNIYAGGYGDADVFVSKLNAQGSALIYSTYLGGRADDAGLAVAVDSNGRSALTGNTSSLDFPSLDAFLPLKIGGPSNVDSFAAMLSAPGNGLIYSSYLGGPADDHGLSIFVDAMGAALLTGVTDSSAFPAVNAFQEVYRGESDAFIVRISPP